MDVRFIGVPRSVVNEAISEMPGWRALGERMLAAAKDQCPVGSSEDDTGRAHGTLRDSLEVRYIGGPDSRLLIGSKSQGTILGYLTFGTEAHWVAPVAAKALRWTKGGTTYFSAGHEVSGITADDFILRACRAVVHEAGGLVA